MPRKKSPKQLQKERDAALAQRKIELEEEYIEANKNWTEEGWDQDYGALNKERWINQRLAEWESQHPLIVTGKYQDKEKITAIYQQKFLEYVRDLCPDVIEELRSLVCYFDELFGENKNNYLTLFEWDKNEIFSITFRLENHINHLISIFPVLEFDPNHTENFNSAYKWGEDRLTLNFLYLFLIDANKEKKDNIAQETNDLLRSKLVFQHNHPAFSKDADEVKLRNLIDKEIKNIVHNLLQKSEDSFFEGSENLIIKYLNNITTKPEPSVEAFLTLKVELLKWAETHNLKKDWILRYAYYILEQLSCNPNIEISDIEIGQWNTRSLEAYSFSFEFDGWFAGDEDKEVYEKRLKERFESKLENYFQGVSRYLELDKVKKITKPIDFDLVKPLVRTVVKKWSLEMVVENDFEICDSIENKKYFKSKIKHLRKELPKFEQFDLPI